jgi:cytochrome c-type biogenesis protein CcmH
MKDLALVICLVFALGLAVGNAAAQEGGPTPSPDEVNAVAKNLYCPVCENVPLDVCGSAACAQWREQIADLLAEGRTPQEIYDYFVAQYGEAVLASPPARGLNWLVYILPPVVILLAAGLLWRSLAAWRAKPAPPAVKTSSAKDDYASQLEAELKKRK